MRRSINPEIAGKRIIIQGYHETNGMLITASTIDAKPYIMTTLNILGHIGVHGRLAMKLIKFQKLLVI
ncbi:hypothetical protein MFFC18_40870 [Mariniblastus fucicola]|uniref:Uncharacterized protein n=1 Tax=Mariniblastus fucicola TaxID=980251 RepID=A0A5B9PNQ1_9BACT|nr:hypothetical protein MFFC18_40870 [Mariniblastus fucicola]